MKKIRNKVLIIIVSTIFFILLFNNIVNAESSATVTYKWDQSSNTITATVSPDMEYEAFLGVEGALNDNILAPTSTNVRSQYVSYSAGEKISKKLIGNKKKTITLYIKLKDGPGNSVSMKIGDEGTLKVGNNVNNEVNNGYAAAANFVGTYSMYDKTKFKSLSVQELGTIYAKGKSISGTDGVNDSQKKGINDILENVKTTLTDKGYYIKETNNTISVCNKNTDKVEYTISYNDALNEATQDAAENREYNDNWNDVVYQSLPEKTSSGDTAEESLDDMMNDADNFISEAEQLQYNETSLQNFSKTFYNIMLTIGIVVAVLVGVFIGIKLMVSSVEEKAEYKKFLVPYIAGCIIVFGGFAIWKIAVTILQGM